MRLMLLLLLVVPLVHAESRLSGTVVSTKGEKISGVTVSAKAGTTMCCDDNAISWEYTTRAVLNK